MIQDCVDQFCTATRVENDDMAGGEASTKGTTEVDRFIGHRVRARRLQLGLSQQKLADALGLTFPQVQKYENGTNRISVSRLQQIAGTLSMDVTEFFEGAPGRREDARTLERIDLPPSARADTRELLAAWCSIADPEIRRSLVEVVRGLARRTG